MKVLFLIPLLVVVGCTESSNQKFEKVKKTTILLRDAKTEGFIVDEWPTKKDLAAIEDPIPENIIINVKEEYKNSLKEVFDTTDISISTDANIKKIGHIKLSEEVRAYQILFSDPNSNFGALIYGVYNQDWFNHHTHYFDRLSPDFQTDFVSGEVKNDTVSLMFRYYNENKPEMYITANYKMTEKGMLGFSTILQKKDN